MPGRTAQMMLGTPKVTDSATKRSGIKEPGKGRAGPWAGHRVAVGSCLVPLSGKQEQKVPKDNNNCLHPSKTGSSHWAKRLTSLNSMVLISIPIRKRYKGEDRDSNVKSSKLLCDYFRKLSWVDLDPEKKPGLCCQSISESHAAHTAGKQTQSTLWLPRAELFAFRLLMNGIYVML